MPELKDVVRRAYSAVSTGDSDALSDLLDNDVVEHDEILGFPPTKQGVLRFFRTFREAFPDLAMTADDMIAEGDKVFVRATVSGTHRGEFFGVPASGNEITSPIADFFRIREGRIVEHWGVADMGALMKQLGSPAVLCDLGPVLHRGGRASLLSLFP